MRLSILLILLSVLFGCKKLLDVPSPGNIIPAQSMFSTDEAANKAIAGLYNRWKNLYNNYSSPTVLGGLSADELSNMSLDQFYEEYETNSIKSTNGYLPWARLYSIVYEANACVEGLIASQSLSEVKKDYYIVEAKFIRAYAYLTLVNFFGDVPLLLSTDVKVNQKAFRVPVDSVYMQIVTDLHSSDSLMQTNIFDEGYRFRVNVSAVTALRSRVNLYLQNWEEAEMLSATLISSGKYKLVADPDSIVIQDNRESIFQFDNNIETPGNFEVGLFNFQQNPVVVLTDNFLSSFENSDSRKEKWVASKMYSGQAYYFPYKYKLLNSGSNERYTLFRLGEQYLIRAEARANLNNVVQAVEDLNEIRGRATLPLINTNIPKDSCLKLISNERRIELFAETPHRWFDLKRSGKINNLLAAFKGSLSWQNSDQLYPIPSDDILRNPNLVQNPKY